jgi:organic hydroperoxide reductase OsmC/OhrA
MGVAAKIRKITLSDGQAIDAEVDLCLTDGEYFLHARLNVSLPRWEREVSTNLGNVALQTYPRSKSPRGYVDIVIDAT